MSHWLEKIIDILESETQDLSELARIAGFNSSSFYRGADLSRTDLRGQDLRKIDLAGTDLSGAIIDYSTDIDEKYRPKSKSIDIIRAAQVPKPIWDYIETIRGRRNYKYRTETLRYMVAFVRYHRDTDINKFNDVMYSINSNREIRNLFEIPRNQRTNISFSINPEYHKFSLEIGKLFSGQSSGYTAIIVIYALIFSDKPWRKKNGRSSRGLRLGLGLGL